MLLSLVLPAGAAELGEPAAVLTAEQPVAQTGEPAVQAEGPDEEPIAIFYTEDHAEYARVDASADGWMPPALPSTEGEGQYLYWLGSYPTEDGVDYYHLHSISEAKQYFFQQIPSQFRAKARAAFCSATMECWIGRTAIAL